MMLILEIVIVYWAILVVIFATVGLGDIMCDWIFDKSLAEIIAEYRSKDK